MIKYASVAVIAISLSLIILVGKKPEVHAATAANKVADLDKPMSASKHIDSIVLGAGCFWGAEKRYAAIPGVLDSVSGYADGKGVAPTYREITKYKHKNNPNNHAEVVKVTFNRSAINLEAILRQYFEGHDPTQVNGQGNDIGTQYRSTILTNSPEQAAIAQKIRDQYQGRLSAKGYGKISTHIKPLTEFFPAEDYHQDYLLKNPKGYCPDHSTGVKFVEDNSKPPVDNSRLQKGQHIVVIESANYCPFCEKFKKEVVAKYTKQSPISFRKANELKGLTIKTPTWATPTILFLDYGKEVAGHQGYMKAEEFYAQLAELKFQ